MEELVAARLFSSVGVVFTALGHPAMSCSSSPARALKPHKVALLQLRNGGKRFVVPLQKRTRV